MSSGRGAHVRLPAHVRAGVSSFSLVTNSGFLLLKTAAIGRWTPHLVDGSCRSTLLISAGS